MHRWTQSPLHLAVIGSAFALLFLGCGNLEEPDDDSADDDAADDDTADDDDAADDDTEICTDENDPDIGTATEMSDELHTDNWFFVYLASMTTDHTGEGDYDWMMQQSPPVPAISLGNGATVVNLGPVMFHDVELAPLDGYVTAGTFDIDYQDGGTGEAGFDMTGNVYVIQTADNHFGKVEILSAKGGTIEWRAYLQDDAGSCNIRTAE